MRMSSLTPISSSSGAKSAAEDTNTHRQQTQRKMSRRENWKKEKQTLLTVALLADLVQNAEELWRERRQRVQLHFLEILRAVFLQVAVVFAQAAHNHVRLREIEKSPRSVRLGFPAQD